MKKHGIIEWGFLRTLGAMLTCLLLQATVGGWVFAGEAPTVRPLSKADWDIRVPRQERGTQTEALPGKGLEIPPAGIGAKSSPNEARDLKGVTEVSLSSKGRLRGEFLTGMESHSKARGLTTRTWVVRQDDAKYKIVRFEEQVADGLTGKTMDVGNGTLSEVVADHFMVRLRDGVGTSKEDMVALEQRLVHMGCRIRERLPMSGLFLIEFDGVDPENFSKVRAQLAELQEVARVEADAIAHPFGAGRLPNDPMFGMLWGLDNTGQDSGTADADIDAPEAWDLGVGKPDTVVAVIDTGVDYNHGDLAGNMWLNQGETGTDAAGKDKRTNGIDDDGNGYVDDVHGWDSYDADGDPMPGVGGEHGTHCSGTIAGVGDNGIGVVGVAWNVRLMACKTFSDTGGGGPASTIVEALHYIVKMKKEKGVSVRVTSNSYGWNPGEYPGDELRDAIAAAGAAGILYVVAAGNAAMDNDQTPTYPASYDLPNVIAVAASDRNDKLASFSCYGAKSVHLAAPGVDVVSTWPGNRYARASGTSMATPHVAGACAVLLSANSNLTCSAVREILLQNADKVPAFQGKCVANGRLNLARCMRSITESSAMAAYDFTTRESVGNGDGCLNPGERIACTFTVANLGLQTASNASVRVLTSDTNIALLRDTVSLGNMAGAETRVLIDAAELTVASNVTTPYKVVLQMVLSNSSGSWTNDIQFLIYSSCFIGGTAKDAMSGVAVPGAKVICARSGSSQSWTLTTGADGRYQIGPVVDGTYTLTAEKAGVYGRTAPMTVTVPPSRTTLDLLLDTPRIVVEPASLSLTIQMGQTVRQSVVVRNERTMDSPWYQITSDGRGIGRILGTFTWPPEMNFANDPSFYVAPVFAGDCYWVGKQNYSFKFFKLDLVTMQVKDSFDLSSQFPANVQRRGVAWDPDRRLLWCGVLNDASLTYSVIAIDPARRQVVKNFALTDYNRATGMIYYDGRPVAVDRYPMGGLPVLRAIDPENGQVVKTYSNVYGQEGGFQWRKRIWASETLTGFGYLQPPTIFSGDMEGGYQRYYSATDIDLGGWCPTWFAGHDGKGGIIFAEWAPNGAGIRWTSTGHKVSSGECPWIEPVDISGVALGLQQRTVSFDIQALSDRVTVGVQTGRVVIISGDLTNPRVEVPVILTVTPPPNRMPVIVTGPTASPVSVFAPATVVLKVVASDPENDPLTYSWGSAGPWLVTFDTPSASTTVARIQAPGTYNFTVVVRDSVGNEAVGAVSMEVLSNRTEKAVSVVPANFDVTMAPGTQTSRLLTIVNDGWGANGVLWNNANETYGGLKYKVTNLLPEPVGLAFDGSHVWCAQGNDYTLVRVDPWTGYASQFKSLKAITVGKAIWDIDWQGTNCWVVSPDARSIFVVYLPISTTSFDVQLIRTYTAPEGQTPWGVSLGGGMAWVLCYNASNQCVVFRMNQSDGVFTPAFAMPQEIVNHGFPKNMAYADGSLWISSFHMDTANALNNECRIYQVDPATGQVRGSFLVPNKPINPGETRWIYGLCKGPGEQDLFVSIPRFFEPRELLLLSTRNVPWLTRAPASGVASPVGATTQTIGFDARALAVGTYQTTMYLYTDDPDRTSIAVPITLHVQNGAVANRIPVSVDDGVYTVPSSGVLTVTAAQGVLANDTDPDGQSLQARLLVAPINGQMTLSADGSFTYRPNAGYSGDDRFVYLAFDGKDCGNAATARISVAVTGGSGTNRPPVANAQSVTTAEDTAKAIVLTGSDPDGDPLTFAVVTQPAHGTLSGTAPNLTYTPASNYNGADSFTFKANDGEVDSALATVSITVAAVNDAPVCSIAAPVNGATFTAPASITIQANASDIDGTIAKVEFYQGATKLGETTTSPYAYVWSGVAAGSYTLTVKATDNSGAVATSAVVNVTVTAVDTGSNVTVIATCDNAYELYVNGVLKGTGNNWGQSQQYTAIPLQPGRNAIAVKGMDAGGVAAFLAETIVNGVRSGSSTNWKVSLTAPVGWTNAVFDDSTWVSASDYGAYGVTPWNKGVAGMPSDTPARWIWSSDANNHDTVYLRYTIELAGGNRAPVAANVSVTTAEDTAKTVALSASDPDGDALTYAIVTGPAHGSLGAVSGSNVVYTPVANYNGADSFTYRASDGKTNSNTATVSVTVTPVNDAPIAIAQNVTTAEDTAKAIVLTGNDPDSDPLTFAVVTQPAHGTLSGTAPNVTYTPAANYNGDDSFTFKANDGKVDSAPVTVSITVTPVNDPPICSITSPANGATFTAPASITIQANASDIDGSIAKVEFYQGATKLGEDTTSPYEYVWTGVAAGSYTLTVKATDNSGAVTSSAGVNVTVTAVDNGSNVTVIATCDNGYELYVNGILKGTGNNWNQSQQYTAIPLQPGRNVIAIKGMDQGGVAGLLVETIMGGVRSGSSANWKVSLTGSAGWTNAMFDDSTWVSASDYGAYGVSPWAKNVVGMPSDTPARWIWSSDANNHDTVYFRCVIDMPGGSQNQPPVALGGVDPINGTTLDEFYFWGTDSYDPDGVVTSYQWTVNSEEVSTAAEFLWAFDVVGTYDVVLTVWDNKGASDSDLVQVQVSEPSVTVSVEVPDGMAGEPGLAEGTGTIRVRRTGSTSAALTVNVAFSGDASNGVDYATIANSVVIPAGASYRDVLISPIADGSDESDELVVLTVLPGTGYTVDSGVSAGLVLIKDQTYGTPVVSAEATDALAKEPMQTTDKGSIKVSRTGSCSAALTVYCTLGGTAVNGVDYTPVTVPVALAVGQSSKVLTIAPLADGVVDSNETVVLTLTTNASYQIAAGKGTATVTIQDTTVLTTPVVSVVATDADAQEPAGGVLNYGYIRFARTTRFHETLTVNCTVGGTASNGVDYVKVTVPIVFAVGEGIKDISIRPIADSVAEGVETAIFTLTVGTGYTVDAGKASATVSIRD